jgi:hypothetical protein
VGSVASTVLTGDAGDQHQSVTHSTINPAKQNVQDTKIVGTEFIDQFTYGPGKNVFKELGTVHLQISVQDPQAPASPVVAALDIDVAGIDDYFSVLTQAATLQGNVADLRAQLGQPPPSPKVTVEAVSALDESISLQASSDGPVRLTAYAYLGSEANAAKARTPAGHSDPQTVEQGDPKTLVVRNLQSGTGYVIVVKDPKGGTLVGPILTDHTEAPLKTLPSINHAHVSVQGVTVKLKEVVLNLQIRDTAKLSASIQKLSSTGNWDSVGAPKEEAVPSAGHKPGDEFPYPFSVPVSLDSDATYRALVHPTTQYDEADKNDDAQSAQFKGVSSALFKTITMSVTPGGIGFSTNAMNGTEQLKMICTAALSGVSLSVPSDISKAASSTAPKCDFTNAQLFPPQPTANPGVSPQPKAAAASTSKPAAPSVVQFTIHVEPIDQSGRSQDQTLSFSASLPQTDAKGKQINWASIAQGVKAGGGVTDSKKPLMSGPLGTILHLFLSLAPLI